MRLSLNKCLLYLANTFNSAKRYERLMRAHGVSSTSGGRSGQPTSSNNTVTTKSRPPVAKKRKLAARGDDLDDDVKTQIKGEIKEEVKHETDTDDAKGSYMAHPETPLETKAEHKHQDTPEATCHASSDVADDEVLLVSEASRHHNETMASVAFMQQMMLPPAPQSFYGFVNHPTGGELHYSAPPLALPPSTAPYMIESSAGRPRQSTVFSDSETSKCMHQHHHDAAYFHHGE